MIALNSQARAYAGLISASVSFLIMAFKPMVLSSLSVWPPHVKTGRYSGQHVATPYPTPLWTS